MKKIALLMVLALVTAQSFAAGAHRFRFSDTLETLRVEDALGVDSEMARKHFIIRASYDYIQDPVIGKQIAGGANTTYSGIRDIHTYMLGFGAMVTKKFLLTVNVPLHRVESWGANFMTRTSSDPAKTRLGDIDIQGKIRISGDKAPLNIAVIPFLSVDTGSSDYSVSFDSLGYGVKFAFDKSFGALKLFLNLGYRHLDYTPKMEVTDVAQGAFGVFYKVNNWLGFNAEYNRDYALRGDIRNIHGVDLAARLSYAGAHFFLGTGIESARGFTDQDFNIYAGLKYGFGKVSHTTCGASCRSKNCKCDMKKCPGKCKPKKKKTHAQALTEELSIKRDIQFQTGSSKIKAMSYHALDTAASAIVKYQDQIGTITVEGHSDSSGKASSNKRLSQKRADSVKAYLVSKGVKADKIQAIGYGEERLKISPEKTAADRAANRRVEFSVSETVQVKK